MRARLGTAWGTHGPSVEKAADLIAAAFGEDPEIERMADLAGPNDTFQFLLEWPLWQSLVVAGATTFGGGFLAQAGADTWTFLKTQVEKSMSNKKAVPPETVQKLSGIASGAREAGNYVILGFPMPEHFTRRNIGIELDATDPEAVMRASVVLGIIGEELTTIINDLIASGKLVMGVGENSDCSTRIHVNADGSSVIHLRSRETGEAGWTDLLLTFAPDGKRLS